jgi:hypothetical protein
LFANIIGYFWGFFWALIIGVPFGLIMNAIKPDSKFIYTLSMVVAGAIFFITQGAKREKLIAKGDLAVWKNVESSKVNSDQPTD